MCGALRASDAGKKAVLMGWVNLRRDHGNLLFVDLRDRSGVTQVVINAERDAAIHEKSAALRNEYVIAVTGAVKLRDANTVNPNMPTGEVVLVAEELRMLNESKLPQSPQLFKQILMISGFDRYFQIVRCFRDEDLRADRQPEFTQIDLEMSY